MANPTIRTGVAPEETGIFFATLARANTSAERIENDATAATTKVGSVSDGETNEEKDGGEAGAAKQSEDGHSNSKHHKHHQPTAPPASSLPSSAPCSAACPPALTKHDRGWRHLVRNFTPSWFSVTMGTGIVSILLHNLPYNAAPVRAIGIAVFVLNVVLFAAFTLISAVRYIAYPEIWGVMTKHPGQSLFLGCIPMGLSTIVTMMAYVCAPWGRGAVYWTWAIWWVDAVVAGACTLIIPFVIVHHHRNQLSHMTAALLLPVVPSVVAAASGGVVAAILPIPSHAQATLVTAYALWGLGEVFSFFIMGVYFLRLQIHDLPPREVIVSVFLPIGPLGQGGFAIQQLGRVALQVLPATDVFGDAALSAAAGTVLYTLGILAGFMLWGAALGWLAFAVISIATTKSFPFNMGWWGLVFPLGVLASCTSALGTELSSPFFKVMTMIFSACVFCLWIIVAIKTAIMAMRGEIFFAPCLRDLAVKAPPPKGEGAV